MNEERESSSEPCLRAKPRHACDWQCGASQSLTKVIYIQRELFQFKKKQLRFLGHHVVPTPQNRGNRLGFQISKASQRRTGLHDVLKLQQTIRVHATVSISLAEV